MGLIISVITTLPPVVSSQSRTLARLASLLLFLAFNLADDPIFPNRHRCTLPARKASNGKREKTLGDSHCCAAERRPRHLLPDFADLLCPDLSLVHAPMIPGLRANSHVSLQLGKETQSIKHTHNFNFSGGLTTSQFPVFTLYLQVKFQQNQMKEIFQKPKI